MSSGTAWWCATAAHPPRTVVTAAGPGAGGAPRAGHRRVDEATGQRKRFSSKILAPWCRKSPKVSEVLPLLYLHGLSSGEFAARAGAVPRLGGRALAGDS